MPSHEIVSTWMRIKTRILYRWARLLGGYLAIFNQPKLKSHALIFCLFLPERNSDQSLYILTPTSSNAHITRLSYGEGIQPLTHEHYTHSLFVGFVQIGYAALVLWKELLSIVLPESSAEISRSIKRRIKRL